MNRIFKDLDIFYNDFELSWEDACERLCHYLKVINPFDPKHRLVLAEINFWLVMFYGKSLDEYIWPDGNV